MSVSCTGACKTLEILRHDVMDLFAILVGVQQDRVMLLFEW